MKVFNARSYLGQSLQQSYRSNEQEKKRFYSERVLQVENGSFTHFVFSLHGGMGLECRYFFKRLCNLIAEKRDEHPSEVAPWTRAKTSLALIYLALMCVRGARHRYYRYKLEEVDIEVESQESP